MRIKVKFSVILACILFALSGYLIQANNGVATEANQGISTVESSQLRPLLNSERIKLKFGSYGIEVLESGAKIRVSNLYSVNGDQKTTRTLAIVSYPDTVDPLFAKEHKEILSGGSIGAVFKKNGWEIDKRHQYFGEIDSSKDLASVYKLFGGITPTQLAVHIYSFFIKKHRSEFLYATIAEIYHPQYLSLQDLKEIYQVDFDKHRTQTDKVGMFLKVVNNKIKNL